MENDFDISIVDNIDDFNSAMELRRQEFVIKQGIPENKEFDGNDFSATHFILKKDNEVIGYMRARYFGEIAKFERLLFKDTYKKQNFGPKMLHFGFDFCAKKGFKSVVSICEKSLLPHWNKTGFKRIENKESVVVGTKEFFPIEYILKPDDNPITKESDFAMFCAKETEFDKAEKEVVKSKIPSIIAALMQKKFKNCNKTYKTLDSSPKLFSLRYIF